MPWSVDKRGKTREQLYANEQLPLFLNTGLPADATGNYETECSASGSAHKIQFLSCCFQPVSGNV